MLTPSANFNTLRERPGNHITQKCVIETGNVALTAKGATAEALTVFSADWPASAVINGDRTHINAGAPSAAENGIGLGVWQGLTLADGSGNLSTPETLTITLPEVKRVNRIKLIFWPEETKNGNLGAIAPENFSIEIAPESGLGYGEGGFGDGGFGGGAAMSAWTGLVDKSAEIGKDATTIAAGVVTGNTNDMNVFEDPTAQDVQVIRITMSKLQSGSVRARVVAVELTLAVDVSDAVMASSRRRSKDYHLSRRQATQLQVSLRNGNGRFNRLHVPTETEIAAGWFNDSIRPNLEMRYFAGFSGVNSQMFSGFIDSWEPDAETRVVKVTARDFFKFLIKPKVSTKLKTSWSLEALVELIANYQNFPSNLMILDTTTISPAYFMPKDKTIQTILNDLQDATGRAEIFFNEFGQLNFRSYLTVIQHIWFQGSEADFLGGTNVNDTDATTEPGALILANTLGVYANEGNWYSALSPALEGKVQFDNLAAAIQTGPATSIDLFVRVTNDAGATFTPWREILPGPRGLLSKWNQWYGQIQIWARLRTSDTAETPKLLDFTVNYTSRGGSNMVSATADWSIKDTTTALGLRQKITDQVGGANYMISKSVVKATPTFVSSGSEVAWQGTYNGEAVSASNPFYVDVGVTTLLVDFGDSKYDVPQTVNMTLGTATATATLTEDPNKPTLTITATVAGTITLLTISGSPFVQNGIIEAIAIADDDIVADYGINEDTLQNDYIDNQALAASIADSKIVLFGQGPLDWIQESPIRFTPNAQLNDRVNVVDRFSELDDDFVAIGFTDELVANNDGFDARTLTELVKIGSAGYDRTQAAYFGGGVYYYAGFRNGGDLTI